MIATEEQASVVWLDRLEAILASRIEHLEEVRVSMERLGLPAVATRYAERAEGMRAALKVARGIAG